ADPVALAVLVVEPGLNIAFREPLGGGEPLDDMPALVLQEHGKPVGGLEGFQQVADSLFVGCHLLGPHRGVTLNRSSEKSYPSTFTSPSTRRTPVRTSRVRCTL